MSVVRQLLLIMLLMGVGFAAWTHNDAIRAAFGFETAAKSAKKRRARRADPVIVEPVRFEADTVAIAVVGTGRAKRSITLRAETAGVITEMALAPDKRFSRGDVVLAIDDRDAQLALALAETKAEEAERALQRAQQLSRRGAGSGASLDAAATQAKITQLELEQTRRLLENHRLRAPFDGVSASPAVEIGDRIDENDAVSLFQDRSALLIEVELPESLLPRLQIGAAARLTTPTAPGVEIEGRVAEINSRVDPTSRTVSLRIEVDNRNDALRPGASFAVALDLPGSAFPAAPELAIQFSRGELHVWRIIDDIAERVPVRLIRRRAGYVLVEGPLAIGDLLVVEGAQRLSPGEKVEVLTSKTNLLEAGSGS